MKIAKEFQPTPGLYFRLSYAMLHAQAFAPVVYLIVVGMLLSLVPRLLNVKTWDAAGLSASMDGAGPALTFTAIVLGLPVVTWLTIRRRFKSQPLASARRFCEFTADGLRNHGEGFNVELAWKSITRVHASRWFVQLYSGKGLVCFVPRALFTDAEIAQLRAWQNPAASASTGAAPQTGWRAANKSVALGASIFILVFALPVLLITLHEPYKAQEWNVQLILVTCMGVATALSGLATVACLFLRQQWAMRCYACYALMIAVVFTFGYFSAGSLHQMSTADRITQAAIAIIVYGGFGYVLVRRAVAPRGA